MKRPRVLVCLLAFGVIVGLAQLTPLRAHTSGAATVSALHTAQPASAKDAAKTFLGKIVQARTQDGQNVYALQEASSQDLFLLDDQAKAEKFEGKQVKVTGTFDMASRTIHVVDIEAV
ncbi:MAG: hypothetical protein LAN62_16770 [Acidobacteriia bacterium]|nr:hypothetical protein [Terriglobia bacterium]